MSFAFIAAFASIIWTIFANSLISKRFGRSQMPFERYIKAILKN